MIGEDIYHCIDSKAGVMQSVIATNRRNKFHTNYCAGVLIKSMIAIIILERDAKFSFYSSP